MDATTNPTPPTLERLQKLNADQITLDDLQEVFETTRAKATTTLDASELLNHANDIGRLAILARRVTEYLRGKGIMTGSEPFKYFERLMNQEAQSIRDLSRRLTPPPTITPVIPPTPPQTKRIIEIKTLVYPSDEQIADALNDGWQINHCATIVAQSGTTNKHAWMLLLQREKPAESIAPLPATSDVGTPPVASAPDKDPESPTQPIIMPAVPDKVAAIVALADTDIDAAIQAGRAANIPLEAMMSLYNRQTLAVGRSTYERLQSEHDARPMRPLGFIAPHMLTQITITDEVA